MEIPTNKIVTAIMVIATLLLPDLLLWVTSLLPEKYNVGKKIYKIGTSINMSPRF